MAALGKLSEGSPKKEEGAGWPVGVLIKVLTVCSGKGEQFHLEWKDFLGDSIFTTDHQKWERSRKLIRPMFVRDK